MTIRKQIVLVVGLALIVLVTLTYISSRFVLIKNLQDLERSNVEKHTEQTLNALSYFLTNLEGNNADWASWDDTYDFIEDVNEEYIDSNLVNDTFAALDINLMAYIDLSGRIVFSKAVDIDSQEEVAITPGLQSFLNEKSRKLEESGFDVPESGMILLDAGPMMVSSQPILHSDDTGPSRGTLVFGRYLDSSKINQISELLGYTVDFISISDSSQNADTQEAIVHLSRGESVFVQTESARYASGYTLIKDVDDKPILILRVDIPRDIYQAGQNSVFILVLYIIAGTVLIGVISVILLQRNVLSRLSRIVTSINHIRETGDTTPIQIGGSDELSEVAETINNMITSLRWSYGQVQESEKRYRLIADNASDVIATTDLQFNPTYISPSVKRMTGYSSEEILADKGMIAFTSSSRKAVINAMQEELHIEDSGQSAPPRVRTIEIEIKRKDGTRIWSEASTTSLRNYEGKVIGFMSIIHDITERKEAQEKLQALYQEESEMRQRLEEELERRIQFTRALVHELKTPITPVLVSSELLLEEVREGPILRIAQNISEGASRLNQRIDELIDLARSEIGALEIKKEHFDLKPYLEEIYSSMKPVAEKSGQHLDIELPVSLGTVYADKDRTGQVVLNLINNAFKFTPSGGRITLRAKRETDSVIVEVEDNGRGMTEEEMETLFKPYYKTEDDRARLSGLGLGLYLSKSFVELQGGRIWVESKRGKGSKFCFSIPTHSAE